MLLKDSSLAVAAPSTYSSVSEWAYVAQWLGEETQSAGGVVGDDVVGIVPGQAVGPAGEGVRDHVPLPWHMDRGESEPEGFLFKAEKSGVGDGLQAGVPEDPYEGLVVQGQQEVGMAQDEGAALLQPMYRGKPLSLNGWVSALGWGVELGPAEDGDPPGLAASQNRCAWTLAVFLHQPPPYTGLAPVSGQARRCVEVE